MPLSRPRAFVRNRTVHILAATVVITAIALTLGPTALSRGSLNQLTSLMLLIALALAWNLIGGMAGQFSLGHSIFVGIGAYGTAMMLRMLGTPLLLTVIVAGALSAVIGVLLAYPLLRLRGPYLAIGSLGMALAAYGWMINWDFTGASSSLPIPRPGLLAIDTLFVWATTLAAATFIAVVLTARSPLGLRLTALRDDEFGAASLGVRRVRTLIPVWALSGFLSGLVGAVYGLQQGSLTVDAAFSIQFSLDAAIICVLGGLGTLGGPVVGAVLVFYLRFYSADYSNLALLIEAIVVVLVVRFFPGGVVGLVGEAVRRIRSVAGGRRKSDADTPESVHS